MDSSSLAKLIYASMYISKLSLAGRRHSLSFLYSPPPLLPPRESWLLAEVALTATHALRGWPEH